MALFAVVGLQIAAFVAQIILTGWDRQFVVDYLALSNRGVSQAYAWQFFTAIFLHNSIWHFAANVLVLYFAGKDVETIIGQRNFLFLYFFGAFAGELGHLFSMPNDAALFAASGGTAAVLLAYATMLPDLEITALILFMLPVRLKLQRIAQLSILAAIALLVFDRTGPIGHSAFLGGALAGWFYAQLLGFGRTSFFQRFLRQRKIESERLRVMTSDQFVAEQIDPLLEKISQQGLESLTRRERRLLAQAREKMLLESNS